MRTRTFREAGVTLRLVDRGTHHELLIVHRALRGVGRAEGAGLREVPLLTSALLGTERAFGRLAPRGARRVLVGGLGFGSTLAGALERAAPHARVLVAEKLETVIRLVSRGGALARLAQAALEDPRVEIVRADVAEVIARERDLDAILLDVDNGPEWASFRGNARLYDRRGLLAAKRALRPGGVFAVWSGYPVDAFVSQLRAAGLRASVVPFRERGRVQARAYVGRRIGRGPDVADT